MVQITKYQQRRRSRSNKKHSRFYNTIRFIILLIVLSFYLFFTQRNIMNTSSIYNNTLDEDVLHKSKLNQSKSKQKCSIYGCIFLPKEWTEQSVKNDIQSMTNSIQNQKQKQLQNLVNLSNDIYGNKNMGGMTQKGKSHDINQDRGMIIYPFYIVDNNEDSNFNYDNYEIEIEAIDKSNNHDFLIAIFDGHGDWGHNVAQFLQDNFYKRLSHHLASVLKNSILTSQNNNVNSSLRGGGEGGGVVSDIDSNGLNKDNNRMLLTPELIKQKLNQTFVEMDQELPPISEGSEYNIGEDGGSTASVILRIGSFIYFANVGDSTSFIASYHHRNHKSAAVEATTNANSNDNETIIIHKNRFDKAHLPDEKERIEKLNGKIWTPPNHPIMARVNAFNPLRKEITSLAMSRSIGDNSHTRIGVIAEPMIDVLNVEELKKRNDNDNNDDIEFFVVSSSDGLYDHRRPQFVASELAKGFYFENEYPTVKSGSIIDLATPTDPNRYLDDITVMALKVVL